MDPLISKIGPLYWGTLECEPGFGNNYFGKSEFGEEGWPGFGVSGYGINEFGISNFYPLIFQRRNSLKGFHSWRILWYNFVLKHSAAQQTRREKFKAGLVAWKALSEEEKTEWKEKAKYLNLYGVSLFLKEWMLA